MRVQIAASHQLPAHMLGKLHRPHGVIRLFWPPRTPREVMFDHFPGNPTVLNGVRRAFDAQHVSVMGGEPRGADAFAAPEIKHRLDSEVLHHVAPQGRGKAIRVNLGETTQVSRVTFASVRIAPLLVSHLGLIRFKLEPGKTLWRGWSAGNRVEDRRDPDWGSAQLPGWLNCPVSVTVWPSSRSRERGQHKKRKSHGCLLGGDEMREGAEYCRPDLVSTRQG